MHRCADVVRSIAFTAVVVGVMGAGLTGCASRKPAGPVVVTKATQSQQAALFEKVKSLEGTWEMADEQGKKQVACVYQVSSNGSVVREFMFPGSPHEMTNVYHMDGGTLVMTHYCAAGNQPRMRASAGDGKSIAFKFDSVSNLTSADETYMGEMTLHFDGPDAAREEWKSLQAGRYNGHDPVFTLTRKK